MRNWDLAKYTPLLVQWVRQTLNASAPNARSISESGFARLSSYFSSHTLQSSKFVITDHLPMPPLTRMGLSQFREFEQGNFHGMSYLDTIFIRNGFQHEEALFFHELIHVVQWRLLGPETFLMAYVSGLEQFGYRHCPLEAMAYDAQGTFESSPMAFDAETFVQGRLNY